MRIPAVFCMLTALPAPGASRALWRSKRLWRVAGELHRHSADRRLIQVAVNGWENIRQGHLCETGGPWSLAGVSYENNECFAPPEFFGPSRPVETCSATTWTQLSLQLLRVHRVQVRCASKSGAEH